MEWLFVGGLAAAGIGAMWYKQSAYPMSYVKSSVDEERYLVRNMEDKQEAADRLARVRERFLRLRKALEQKHAEKPFVQNILKNCDFAADRFSESTPDASFTSYSVNKGEKVYICLRQRDSSERLVDENILTFVGLHEMAHIGTASIGHTSEFWNNFAWLLQRAEEMNLYKYQDFAAHPVAYCGVQITDSPTYKEGIKDDISSSV
jgi:hypothetical protein